MVTVRTIDIMSEEFDLFGMRTSGKYEAAQKWIIELCRPMGWFIVLTGLTTFNGVTVSVVWWESPLMDGISSQVLSHGQKCFLISTASLINSVQIWDQKRILFCSVLLPCWIKWCRWVVFPKLFTAQENLYFYLELCQAVLRYFVLCGRPEVIASTCCLVCM
jgi:hypothetical protein